LTLEKLKFTPIEMSDGTVAYMDTRGMKPSEIKKFQDEIYDWSNDELTSVSKKDRVRGVKTKSKPEKSKKLKNR
jgi:hypothetical protein